MQASLFWWTVAAGALGTALGSLVVLLWPSGDKGKYQFRDNTFTGEVKISDTTLQISNDNRIYITARAATEITRSRSDGPEVEEELQRLRYEQEKLKQQQKDLTSQRDGAGADNALWYFASALVIVIVGYVRFREQITLAVSVVCAFALAFSLSGVISAHFRRVALETSLKLQVGSNLLLTVAGLYGLRWLSNPPFASTSGSLRRLLQGESAVSFESLIREYDRMNTLLFISYQVLGLVFLLLSLFLIFVHTTKIFAIIGLAVRMRAAPDYLSGRVRSWVLQQFGSPWRSWAIGTVATLFSLALISGAAFSLAQKISSNNIGTLIPTEAPTSTP